MEEMKWNASYEGCRLFLPKEMTSQLYDSTLTALCYTEGTILLLETEAFESYIDSISEMPPVIGRCPIKAGGEQEYIEIGRELMDYLLEGLKNPERGTVSYGYIASLDGYVVRI